MTERSVAGRVEEMCAKLLANPVIEDFTVNLVKAQ
jgi:phosphoribosylformylglycinamidine (FGAM) synthase PurS component